jgi:phosphogluconate dehydratase
VSTIHPALAAVTERITERSSAPRAAYLQQTREAEGRGPARGRLACANLAAQFPRLPGSNTNPAGCYDRHRTAPPGAVWQPARRAELSRTLTGPLSVEDVLSGVDAAAVD